MIAPGDVHPAQSAMISLRRGLGAICVAYLGCCLALAVVGNNDRPHFADVAVVLGNKVNPDGVPSLMLKARLDHTVELYRAGLFHLVLVSGGLGKEGYDEPKVMKQYLVKAGIPSAIIIEDTAGKTTWDTARDTRTFLTGRKLRSVLIISQYFHLPRCRVAFARFGIEPVYWSHADFWSIRDLYSVPREVVGLGYYALRRDLR